MKVKEHFQEYPTESYDPQPWDYAMPSTIWGVIYGLTIGLIFGMALGWTLFSSGAGI
jgi:high-affinity Fe2+/Pb2+ permease